MRDRIDSVRAERDRVVGEKDALLQRLADVAWWGPQGPEGGNSPDSPTFTPADAVFRIGVIFGELSRHGFMPSKKEPPLPAA